MHDLIIWVYQMEVNEECGPPDVMLFVPNKNDSNVPINITLY